MGLLPSSAPASAPSALPQAGEAAGEDGSGEERVKAELLQPGCTLHPLPSSHLFLDCLPGKRT